MQIEKKIKSAIEGKGTVSDTTSIVITKVLVNKSSKEFKNPTKPIGRFYTKTEAAKLKGIRIKKLIGGYRRVVPSPLPEAILQKKEIAALLKSGKVVIACGGGGIPVINKHKGYEYVEAVIDKDRASALLAEELHADRFVVLTNVNGAYTNFMKRNQKPIRKINAGELYAHLNHGQFESGSMKPKIEACIEFTTKTGNPAAIGSLSKSENAINLKASTVVTP